MSCTIHCGSVSSALTEEAAVRFLAGLRAVGGALEHAATTWTGPEPLNVNDHALSFFRHRIAAQRPAFPLLSQMQISSVLLASADVPGGGVRLAGEDFGDWEILPLRPVMAEAAAGLRALGARRPSSARLAGAGRKDTTEDDAILLLAALSAWGSRAAQNGGCLWLIA
jgi:hypothetical protein